MSRLSPRDVIHVQLAEPLQPLPAGNPARGVYAVFWLGDLPLGHEYFDAEELPVEPGDLALIAAGCVTPAVGSHLFPGRLPAVVATSRESPSSPVADYEALTTTVRPLADLRRRQEKLPGAAEPQVSLVIITRDRPAGLARCLRSVEQSTFLPHEVMVLDSGDDHSNTHEVTRSFDQVLHVPLGESQSRSNHSVSLPTTGDIVAFTDDRSTVHPKWLWRLTAPFSRPAVTAVSGLVLPSELETEAQVAFERLLGGFNLGMSRVVYEAQWSRQDNLGDPYGVRLGTPANLAVRAEILAKVDVSGEVIAGDGFDYLARLGFWREVLAGEKEGRYEPAAVVFRQHDRGPDEAARQAYRRMSEPSLPVAVRAGDRCLLRGIQAPLLSTERHLIRTATRVVPFGSALERRLLFAGVAGYLAGMGPFGGGRTARAAWSRFPSNRCKALRPSASPGPAGR